ncbi:serine/threonine-protein kinase [Archangium sp.]|uniref:serine/threonine-protein kinase n=1 Tax=Archangium sp. TaxID=1872627 RepID=UPI002D5AD4AA|nr:serine/threonine-protein kinase [Archangium sp.]HYO58939.1 serine/threonine-protein kinase [Archangium sp.]
MSSEAGPDKSAELRETLQPSSHGHETGTDPLLGTCIGSFRLTRGLGQGGMGAVYLGEHVDIGSRVAIKVLHGRLATSPQVLRRFHMEARAVNLIGHENIVNIIDINPAPPRPYLVMEYLEGEPLSALLSRGPVRAEVAVAMLAQVCDALQATHARGIVHRDLKPENLFLLQRGHRPAFVKVLDFGIAKLLDAEERGTDTGEGAIIGSADYMAPEQSRGDSLDGRADLYALGVIAYQLVTGRLPFVERSLTALLLAHQTKQPPSPASLNPGVPPALSSVILRALAKNPEDRYPSASTMRGALQGALDRGRSPAGPARTPPPIGPLAVRPALAMPVLVTASPGAAAEQLTCTDLTRGGLFLCTDLAPPPLLSRVLVALEHPEGELTCECEVVRHVRPEEARAWGMAAGFGVQFMEPSVSFKAAVAHLMLGQPLNTLRPPMDPSAEAEVEQVLAPYRERGTEDLYAFLALPPDTGCEELRVRARRACHALERLRERPISPPLRARMDTVLERMREAAETLGHPQRRAAYDAERGNFQGVARCLAAGLTATQMEELRRDFLARRPHTQGPLRVHLATAQAHQQAGLLAHARGAYERALILDPLCLELHQQYLAVCRAMDTSGRPDPGPGGKVPAV